MADMLLFHSSVSPLRQLLRYMRHPVQSHSAQNGWQFLGKLLQRSEANYLAQVVTTSDLTSPFQSIQNDQLHKTALLGNCLVYFPANMRLCTSPVIEYRDNNDIV